MPGGLILPVYRGACHVSHELNARAPLPHPSFQVYNYYEPIKFLFLRGGFSNKSLVAESEPVTASNPQQPAQIKLAFTEDPRCGVGGRWVPLTLRREPNMNARSHGCHTRGALASHARDHTQERTPPLAPQPPNWRSEMRVTWLTQFEGAPFVRYGLAEDELDAQVPANVTTYTAADLCGAPANSTGWKAPGMINSGVMAGLEPNTRYYYVVGDEVRWAHAGCRGVCGV